MMLHTMGICLDWEAGRHRQGTSSGILHSAGMVDS